jgi:hypothetical protein
MKRWLVNVAVAAGAAATMVVIAAGTSAAETGSPTVDVERHAAEDDSKAKDPGNNGCWDWQLRVSPPPR